jgi:hypothetical protein
MSPVSREGPEQICGLADALGRTHRTIRRYVYALQAVGLDIVERRPKGTGTTYYRLERRSWHGLPYLPVD